MLPIHEAGSVGQKGTVLTVEGTNDPSGKAITQLQLSGEIDHESTAFKTQVLDKEVT